MIDLAPLPAESSAGLETKLSNFFSDIPAQYDLMAQLPDKFRNNIQGIYNYKDLNDIEIKPQNLSGQDGTTFITELNGSKVAIKILDRTRIDKEKDLTKLVFFETALRCKGNHISAIQEGIIGMVAARVMAVEEFNTGKYPSIYALPIALISNENDEIIGYCTPFVEGEGMDVMSSQHYSERGYSNFINQLRSSGLDVDTMDIVRNSIVVGGFRLNNIASKIPREHHSRLDKLIDQNDTVRESVGKWFETRDIIYNEVVPQSYKRTPQEIRTRILDAGIVIDNELDVLLKKLEEIQKEIESTRNEISRIGLERAQNFLTTNNLPYEATLDEDEQVADIPPAQTYLIDIGVQDMKKARKVLGYKI